MNDNRKQLRMLHHLARAMGFRTIGQWARTDLDGFLSAAMSWRQITDNIVIT